jgi:hypothetical protein
MARLAGLVFLLLVLMVGLSDGTIGMTGIFLAICFVFPLPFFLHRSSCLLTGQRDFNGVRLRLIGATS